MNAKVIYFSKTGNTKKLAEKIATTIGCSATEISGNSSINESTDLLFLGASVYWGGIDGKVKEYINHIDAHKVKEVVIFSTSALAERAFPDIKKRLERKGIKVRDENYYCRGQFTAMYKGRPNQDDLKEAEKFALKMIGKRG